MTGSLIGCSGVLYSFYFNPFPQDFERPQSENWCWTNSGIGWEQWMWEEHNSSIAAEVL